MATLSTPPPRPQTLLNAFNRVENTKRVQRTMRLGMASGSPAQVVAMVIRARRRGQSYASIAQWLGPRACCPRHLQSIHDRVGLFASLEEAGCRELSS